MIIVVLISVYSVSNQLISFVLDGSRRQTSAQSGVVLPQLPDVVQHQIEHKQQNKNPKALNCHAKSEFEHHALRLLLLHASSLSPGCSQPLSARHQKQLQNPSNLRHHLTLLSIAVTPKPNRPAKEFTSLPAVSGLVLRSAGFHFAPIRASLNQPFLIHSCVHSILVARRFALPGPSLWKTLAHWRCAGTAFSTTVLFAVDKLHLKSKYNACLLPTLLPPWS